MKTEEQTKLTDDELSTPALNGEENVVASFKPFLLGIAGLAIVIGILVFLPMILTYLSSGDARAPSQLHAPDPMGKSDHNIYKPIKSNK
jgi:hypothetical protein